ncbi:MAG: hypothetical protein M3014_00045 [Chloroflexota bacterium]|nr:hypothetical protein [Chloroflexota bacterium]
MPEASAAPRRMLRTRLMGVLRVFIASLPTPAGYFLADRLGDVGFRVARRSRLAAISNMRHVLGPVSMPDLKWAVRQVFHNVTRSYYDLCRAPSLTDAEIDKLVDFDEAGWERVAQLHREGRGVILVSGHFGAFDEITQVITRHGVPITVLVAKMKPAWLSDFITDLRAARGLHTLLVDDEEGRGTNLGALKKSMTILRSGEVLGVVADRNMEQQGVHIPFFGYETVVAPGVAKMALRTRAAVVVSFCTRLPGGRYSVIFDEPIEPVGSASNEEDIRNLLMKIFARFEYHIGRTPEQWILLQPVWPLRAH